jgi:hypothetical protein
MKPLHVKPYSIGKRHSPECDGILKIQRESKTLSWIVCPYCGRVGMRVAPGKDGKK